MKRIIIIIIAFFVLNILTILSFLWFYPMKSTVSEKCINLSNFLTNDNIVLMCTNIQSTPPDWQVINSVGSTKTFDYVYICGNTPEKILKKPAYNYYGNTFIFSGYFINEGIFCIDSWYIVGNIERKDLILPYPKKYLNFFEISFQ